jgi:uncharacterized membrane protein
LFGNQIQTLLLLLDLDVIVIIIIFLLASKSCLYHLPVAEFSYTSLGQGIYSKSYAISAEGKRFQELKTFPGTVGLTTVISV